MTTWSDGYVSEIGYTYGYYAELNPVPASVSFLKAGLAMPHVRTACELGFGQGISINAHAAGSDVRWYGTDFNPSQAGFAQELAQIARSSASLSDQSFKEFCGREDLPDFDFIGLHGIWSWISNENRHIIVDFIRRKLRVGGVLYISYNTLPGWAAAAPLRHVLSEHHGLMSARGQSMEQRVKDSVDFAGNLIKLSDQYTEQVPSVTKRLERISKQSKNYLAHEYLNRNWQPMYFSEMQGWLEPAKVSYACSANFLDDFDLVNLNTEQQAFLAEIPDSNFQQTAKDYLLLKQFRRDYWVKGPRPLNDLQQSRLWRDKRVLLITPKSDVSLEIDGARKKVQFLPEIYNPILQALDGYKPVLISQLEEQLKPHDLNLNQLTEALILLHCKGDVVFAQDEQVQQTSQKQADRLNLHLMNLALTSNQISALVSPVVGGAVSVSRFSQIFLLAGMQGKTSSRDLAEFAWQAMCAQDEVLLKDGKGVQDKDENLKMLEEMAVKFKEKILPRLLALAAVAA